ncbi:hypothetical protein [Butyrivibrio sp. VCD2006]|uniref:hypothetical protein n=1 Tax=Butyrivibrio sp. VCD2006 TaxID=1280664 RepID=UPI00041EFCDD|nr:hypothetical protein [Butyrivibrio sp. VCD2006]
MFSKELQILDRNTIKYMIDELQEQLDAANDTIANDKATISNMTKTIADLQSEIERLKNNQK